MTKRKYNAVNRGAKKMIDCSKTENYLTEKKRMTKITNTGVCKIKCTNCPLSEKNNGKGRLCVDYELHYPEKAIEIVQKWSDKHPRRTYLSELLKWHPDVALNAYGIPIVAVGCPPCGVDKCVKSRNCIECWNQPIPIKEDEE